MKGSHRKRGSFTIKRKVTRLNAFNAEVSYMEKVAIIRGGNLDMITGEMISKGGRNVVSSTHLLVCSMADVQVDDHMVIDGKEYKVTFVYNPMGANRHLEIELESLLQNDKQVGYIYCGISSKPSLTQSEIMALNSRESKDKYVDQELSLADEYVYFAYPLDYGMSTVRLNDRVNLDFKVDETAIDGNKYLVYRSEKLEGTHRIQNM